MDARYCFAAAVGIFVGRLFTAATADAAGFAYNANFSVLATEQHIADEVLARADKYRKEVAEFWLGEALPPGAGKTTIHVTITDAEDSALTWIIDSPLRKRHKMWVSTSYTRAVGSTLKHEIAHVVLATYFGGRLPTWLDEGVASQHDDARRKATRRELISRFARTGRWPGLSDVFSQRTIDAGDQAGYAVAASVTEYLIARRDRATLLQFAAEADRHGWDRALTDHYRIANISQLQTGWRAWVKRGGAAARTSRNSKSSTPANSSRSAGTR